MIDPQTVDVAVGDERQHQTVGRLEHVRVLLAQAGELVDVEEPAVAAGDRVDVEELLAPLEIGPVAGCSSSAAMWLGTTSRTIPRPASRAA